LKPVRARSLSRQLQEEIVQLVDGGESVAMVAIARNPRLHCEDC
jgi:hypothetical protein